MRDVGLELRGIESGGSMELQGSFGRIPIRGGEGNDDDVPLRGDFAKRKRGTGASVAGPISDELMMIGRAASRRGRRRGFACRGNAARRAGLGTFPQRTRVGEAVAGSETFGRAEVPGEERGVLQMVGGPA